MARAGLLSNVDLQEVQAKMPFLVIVVLIKKQANSMTWIDDK